MSERLNRKQIKRIRPPHPSEAKPQTRVHLTTRRFDDIARDVRDQAIDFAP